MKGTDMFIINGENLELPLYEAGDRVFIRPADSLSTIPVEGTVLSTEGNGLYVNVEWDQTDYPCVFGGTVQIGQHRLVDGIRLLPAM